MIKFGAVLLSLSLLAPAVLGADAPASPPDPHLVWDLSELYPSDTAWDAERKSIAEALPGLASFKGTLGNDAARLAKALHTVSDLRRRLGRLDTYASLKRDEDTRNASNQDRLQRVELLENDFSTASAYMDPEVVAIGATKINQFIAADPALKSFVFGLKDTLRLAPHTLGDQAEGVLAASGEVRGAPGRIDRGQTSQNEREAADLDDVGEPDVRRQVAHEIHPCIQKFEPDHAFQRVHQALQIRREQDPQNHPEDDAERADEAALNDEDRQDAARRRAEGA